jgi:hypothetical protein
MNLVKNGRTETYDIIRLTTKVLQCRMSIIDVEKMTSNREEKMSNIVLPQRYDWVEFSYKGEDYRGEVRRVLEKPKGMMMVVKIGHVDYRSCYLDQCEKLINISTQPEA